jgi:hypothetical protein
VRAAFVVGWDSGFPWDVFAIFTSRREAQRHADAAAYVFRVFVLPVYEGYDEVPRAFRPPWKAHRHVREQLSDEVALTTDALMDGEIEVVEAGPVVALVDLEPPELGEVRLLFTHVSPAARCVQDAVEWRGGVMRWETMSAYRSYDECPPEQRYTEPGPASPNMCIRDSRGGETSGEATPRSRPMKHTTHPRTCFRLRQIRERHHHRTRTRVSRKSLAGPRRCRDAR